jgi:branched-chain amino acid transport system permease protein
LTIPIAAAGATILAFPFLSIEGDGTGARITARALQLGGAVLVLGYAGWGLRLLHGVVKPRVDLAGPAMLARLADRRVVFALSGALILGAVIFQRFAPGEHVNLAFETLVYMTLALGLNVVVGYGGLLVLGYAAFWAIGAYTFAILTLHFGLNMWVAFPVSGLAAMLAGLLVGLPSLRLRGDYLAIVTLGFGEVVYYFLKTEVDLTGGEMGLPNKDIRGSLQAHTSLHIPGIVDTGPLTDVGQYFWPALLLVILAVVVIKGVEKSRIGRALVAMREDEIAAQCMGINTVRLKLSTFAFAAMWAGFAGVLWAAKTDFVTPKHFYFIESAWILAMVVLGGMGSIPGVMVGAVVIYAVPPLLRQEFPDFQHYRLLVFGALMVLVMIYRPQGLFGFRRQTAPAEEEEAS